MTFVTYGNPGVWIAKLLNVKLGRALLNDRINYYLGFPEVYIIDKYKN